MVSCYLHWQGAGGMGGTHNAVLSSSEYLSQARRNFNNIEDGFYISPAFLDKMTSELWAAEKLVRSSWNSTGLCSTGATHAAAITRAPC